MNNKITCAVRAIASALAIAFLSSACASVPAADPRADYPMEKAQIEHCLQEIFAAAAKDFSRLDGYHFYGPKFTKFSGSSPERLDANAGRKGEHEGLGASRFEDVGGCLEDRYFQQRRDCDLHSRLQLRFRRCDHAREGAHDDGFCKRERGLENSP